MAHGAEATTIPEPSWGPTCDPEAAEQLADALLDCLPARSFPGYEEQPVGTRLFVEYGVPIDAGTRGTAPC